MFSIIWKWKNDSIYNKIKYVISLKSGITYIISHNYSKIRVDSHDTLPQEKVITFHNVVILSKSAFSVFNKDKSNYYCNIFLEKASYELPKKSFCIKCKWHIMIKWTCQKELMIIRQANQKSFICHYWYCLNKGFNFQTYVCNRSHDLSMMSMNLNEISKQISKIEFKLHEVLIW